MSRHHAGNLISVYGLSTWHNSCNTRWKWNLMIRPHSKRTGAVWGKTVTSCSVSKQKLQAARSTNTNLLATFCVFLPTSQFHPSAIQFTRWFLPICPHSLLLALHTNSFKHVPATCDKRLRCGAVASQWCRKNRERHNILKYLAVIFLSVLWWCVIFHSTRHRSYNPTNNTFSQAEVQGPFWNHNKNPRCENAVTKYPERHFPPQLGKEALR